MRGQRQRRKMPLNPFEEGYVAGLANYSASAATLRRAGMHKGGWKDTTSVTKGQTLLPSPRSMSR